MTDTVLRSPIASDDPLAAAVDAMDEGLLVYGPDKKLDLVNRRAAELLDLPEFMRRPGTAYESMVDYLASTDSVELKGDTLENRTTEALATGTSYEYERRRLSGTILKICVSPSNGGGWVATVRDVTAERHAARELRRSEERYRGIVNTQWEAVCRWRPDGILTFANDAYCRMLGISAGEISERRIGDAAHPDDRAALHQHLNRLGPQTPSAEFENRILDAGGNIRWMLWTTSAVFDHTGRISEYQAAGHDITERVDAQREARAVESQFRSVIDALPVCIAYILSDGCYALVNKTYETWFGKNREDIIGKHAREIIGESALKTLQKQMDIALSGRASTFEGSVPYQSAGQRFVQWSYVPNFAADGTVQGFFSVVTDLTERVRATQALKESEDRYKRLIETSPDAIIVHQNNNILFVNPAGAKQFRLKSTDAAIGRNLEEFIHSDHLNLARRIIDSSAPGDGDVLFEEIRLIRDDGTSFDVEVAAIHLVYQGEDAIQLVCRDITSRNIAQAQMMQTAKLATLGEMAASIAHELNQPLNVIRMAADNSLLMIEEDGEFDLNTHNSQFAKITEQTIRMADIVDHMLEFARIDDELNTPIDPMEAIRRSGRFCRDMFRTDNIQLDLNLCDDDIRILGHRVLLEQLFVGILQNARDAILSRAPDLDASTVDGGIIVDAKLSANPDIIAVAVTDNGGGIREPDLDRIFEPFVTTKPVGRGTGLGLSIASEIVKRMDGTMTAENITGGARFTIKFPVVAPDQLNPDLQ
jgi:PAS domain S-box-containing protein